MADFEPKSTMIALLLIKFRGRKTVIGAQSSAREYAGKDYSRVENVNILGENMENKWITMYHSVGFHIPYWCDRWLLMIDGET